MPNVDAKLSWVGTGAASGNLAKQWPELIKYVPEPQDCFQGTINVDLPIPVSSILPLLISAATVAVLFGTLADDNLGIASDTIRADALSSAGFLFIVLAVGDVLAAYRNRASPSGSAPSGVTKPTASRTPRPGLSSTVNFSRALNATVQAQRAAVIPPRSA
jgi:hypothetical protein